MIEAVAFQGVGVFETLKEIAKQVLTELKAGASKSVVLPVCLRFNDGCPAVRHSRPYNLRYASRKAVQTSICISDAQISRSILA